jgi:penicillin amidase
LHRAAESAYLSLDSKTRHYISSYTRGVNAYIKQGHFPIEIQLLRYQPKPWTDVDSIAWQKIMSWNLQKHSWLNKINYGLAKLYFGDEGIHYYFPDYSENKTIHTKLRHFYQKNSSTQWKIHDPDFDHFNETPSVALGSNAWVVSGRRTNTGKPLLANDTHLSLNAPNLWYLVELKGPTLHVIGATIPGMPSVAIGHNDDIAWGVTNGYNDAAELYIINKNDRIRPHNEIIKVRHHNDISYTVWSSDYGPIINDVTPELKPFKNKIALKWTGLLNHDTTIQSFIKINYAHNWKEFQTALNDFITPTQNFLYADREGNIGYYYPGLLPIRHFESLTPLPTEKKYQWKNTIPFSQLPHEFNPSHQIISSANYKIFNCKPYCESINARWPVAPYRINRINQLLAQSPILTISDMVRIQSDVKSEFWQQLKPYLLKVKPIDEVSQTAKNILKNWSGEMDRKDIAPTIFSYWIDIFSELTPTMLRQKNKPIEPAYLLHRLQTDLSNDYLQISLKKAMNKLQLEHGDNPQNWQWGKIHKALFSGYGFGQVTILKLIWNREIESPGGNYTVNVSGFDSASFQATKAATYRQIIDLHNFDQSLYMIPMGQSGNPFSKHYSDLLKPWRDNQYVTIPSLSQCHLGMKNCLVLQAK